FAMGKKSAATLAGPSKPAPAEPHLTDEEENVDGSGSDAGSSQSSDDGVDEEGMERLMNALGEDGLDDFERMQLHLTLGGGDESSDDEEFVPPQDDDSDSQSQDVDAEDLDEALGSDEEEEEDVALDEVESVDADAVPRQKIEIDNTAALARIRETIKLDSSLPWTETLVISYPETIDVDVNDDLNRELAFYKQALHSATAARALAAKHDLPFSRPSDYFAEMVKSDSHMERIRQRLLDERAGIKKSEDKRREREGKKFGKQVQIEKLKERERSKKEMEERLKGLKRKRGEILDKPTAEDDGFDIAVEDAISDRPAKRGRGAGPNGRGGDSKISRRGRDQKFGFGGGAGKRSKSNTRESTDDFGGSVGKRGGRGAFGRGGSTGRGGRGASAGRGGRGAFGGGRGARRLGKSKREAGRGRK
ncbi:eukaryotic rRNA processing protein EBP2-domain-containing protein, partial [Mycena amicta]